MNEGGRFIVDAENLYLSISILGPLSGAGEGGLGLSWGIHTLSMLGRDYASTMSRMFRIYTFSCALFFLIYIHTCKLIKSFNEINKIKVFQGKVK